MKNYNLTCQLFKNGSELTEEMIIHGWQTLEGRQLIFTAVSLTVSLLLAGSTY